MSDAKMFRSCVGKGVTVWGNPRQHHLFFTMKNSRYNKKSKSYEDTPFYSLQDLYFLREILAQAITWGEATMKTLPKPPKDNYGQAAQPSADDNWEPPVVTVPDTVKSDQDDDIPF